jgi:hypothetical protein
LKVPKVPATRADGGWFTPVLVTMLMTPPTAPSP